MSQLPIIAVLLGDASGVGPEIVARLSISGKLTEWCRPLLLGDEEVLKRALELTGGVISIQTIEDVRQAKWDKSIPLLRQPHPAAQKVQYGEINADCGRACIHMIEKAVALYQEGLIDGVCYAPLSKTAMKKAGSVFESETELMASLLGHEGACCEINMLDHVWTTRVTSHIPISAVSGRLSIESILSSIKLALRTLTSAGIENVRIGVAALNPHAGENGLCGTEEIEMIAPAVTLAREQGVHVVGPVPADILFSRAFKGEFDAVVTMYHDQGQIALKLKGFERGVTICGGLSMPATTCAHGTAFDIAGKGIASAGSLERALEMVSTMAANHIETNHKMKNEGDTL